MLDAFASSALGQSRLWNEIASVTRGAAGTTACVIPDAAICIVIGIASITVIIPCVFFIFRGIVVMSNDCCSYHSYSLLFFLLSPLLLFFRFAAVPPARSQQPET